MRVHSSGMLALLLCGAATGVAGSHFEWGSELCTDYKNYRWCVHVESYDEATNVALLSDKSDGLCFKYVTGEKTLEKMACGPGALTFTRDDPAEGLFKAVGITEDWCLESWLDEQALWGCTPGKAKQVYLSTWKGWYSFPCATPDVGNTQAVQCGCVSGAEELYGTAGDLVSYHECLSGRVRGATGARTLTSMRPENMCNGQPAPLQSLADWEDAQSMYVYWAEDTPDYSTAVMKISRVTFTGTSASVVAELSLPGCVQGSSIVRGKGDTLAVLCAEHVGWDSVLFIKVVEVTKDLKSEVRRFSALAPECETDGTCEGQYPMQKGADFRWLEYIPTKNWYVAWYNAGWGIHVADQMRVFDADTTDMVPGVGSGWACQNGHTQTGRMVYNPVLDELAALCCSDTGGECTDPTDSKQACDAAEEYKNGVTFRTHIQNKVGPVQLAPLANVYSQAISGWIGDIVSCSDGFALVWVGADGLFDTYTASTNDVGFMRVKVDGEIILQTWPVGQTGDRRERSAKLAKLGKGDCDRFLLGWGDLDVEKFYPQKYSLVELDGSGKQLTTPVDVTEMTQWAEETVWTTMEDGDVAWAHTWKRNVDGTPNKVGEKTWRTGDGGKTCSYDGNGYGYSWGSDPTNPGRRFHTNEAFFMRYESHYLDECNDAANPTPCGDKQTCADPTLLDTSVGDYVCTCTEDTSITATGVAATCSANECDDTPCGTGQTCADPNPVPSSRKDFTCTCDSDTSIIATGASATCVLDECAATTPPCGSGQTCTDPDTSYKTQHDFVCTCDSDSSISNTDGPATCTKDECAATPCAAGQTCADPDQSAGSLKDFTCTCGNGVMATGASATCDIDECAATTPPCGSGQTCKDPDTAYTAQNDYVCTCDKDATISNTGGPATCTSDECAATPCAAGQTCDDPDQSATSLKDFTCTCGNGVKATGGSATCDIDECAATTPPCGSGQTCKDPDTAYTSQNDYVCTCDKDATISNTGGPATCTKDECAATPCAAGQTCADPDQSAGSLKDFTCTCDNDATAKATGTSVQQCTKDECATTPCGTGQSCADPDMKIASTNDYVCTCAAAPGVTQIGSPAICTKDECADTPCGAQMCTDPDMSAASIGDFECECSTGAKKTGGPAVCASGSLDECASDPCPGQTCVDPDTTAGSTNDFLCTCTTGTGSATGTAATCEVDECATTPCAAGQDCSDPVKTAGSTGDFACSCRAPATGTQQGAAAVCVVDECTPTACAAGQTCADADTSPSSLLDFTCTCANGAKATGGFATCDIDECAATTPPCGAGQTCKDPDTSYTSQHDFVCTCDSDSTLTQKDGPATCTKDECAATPCAAGQTCADPDQSAGSLKDFTCTCDNGAKATGGSATCDIDECAATTPPCGSGQTCKDPDTAYTAQNDYVCTCDSDASLTRTGGPATCTTDECAATPCAPGQVCKDPNQSATSLKDFTCTCGNGATATGGWATCDIDECGATTPPCGSGQTCKDPDTSYTAQHDFVCTCDEDDSITRVDGPASCASDECRHDPCGLGQTCRDPDTGRTSLKDFTCTCDNGVVSTGGAATCELDECAATPPPCGVGQLCTDPDVRYTSSRDFVCQCANTTAKATGHAARCDLPPTGSTPSPTFPPSMPATDTPLHPPTPPPTPPVTAHPSVPTSPSPWGTPETFVPGEPVVVVTCVADKTTFDKKRFEELVLQVAGHPAGNTSVSVTDTGETLDVTTAFTGEGSAEAARILQALLDEPTDDLHATGLRSTADDSSSGGEGTPWWVWALAGLGGLLCVGGIIVFALTKRQQDTMSLHDFMETQQDEMRPTKPREPYATTHEFASI